MLFLKTSAVSIHSSMFQGLSALEHSCTLSFRTRGMRQLERVITLPGALSVYRTPPYCRQFSVILRCPYFRGSIVLAAAIYFILAYYQTAKFKSSNLFIFVAMATWALSPNFNSHQYFWLCGIIVTNAYSLVMFSHEALKKMRKSEYEA